LIVNGADLRRIFLMKLSRGAASEMSRHVERMSRRVLGTNAALLTDAPGQACIHALIEINRR
jgi:hypothetical protein